MERPRKGGEIKKVSQLFEVYKKRLRAPQGSVIAAFQEVVNDVTGLEISKGVVSYTPSTRTLSLRSSGPLKSEILLNKDEILTHLKGRLGEQGAPRDII